MNDNGKERFVFTKSYEIAYALFRIAGTMKEKDFPERLRSLGAALLEATAGQDYGDARKALQGIECFVKFAGDVGLMGPANTDTLLREVYVLDAAVIERMNAAKSTSVDLSEIFSQVIPAVDDYPATSAPSEASSVAVGVADAVPNGREPAIHFSDSEPSPSIKAEIRQSAILEKIRQSGNCRIKDLQDILPASSERTIRYDLQSLLERNLIERIGNGGPSVSYRIRQSVTSESGATGISGG
jgi:hypothetical protein